jgi:hypothetical protein
MLNTISMMQTTSMPIIYVYTMPTVPYHLKSIDHRVLTVDNVDFAYTIILNPLFQYPSPTSTLHHSNRTLVIAYPPQQYLALPEYLSRTILTLFASERRYIQSVLHRSTNDLGSLPEFARRVVRGSRKYQVTFSLLNGGGEEVVESWDIAEALQRIYLLPLDKNNRD